jgi:hypothetical protein
MAGLLGKLVLKMSADSAEFESNMAKARQSSSDFGASAVAAGAVAGKALAAAGAAAIAAGVLIVKSNLASIDSLAKVSDKLGISTEALAGFRHAAELSGTSQEAADKALQKMVRSIGEAQNGVGMARVEFEKMGLSVQALAGMKPEQAFAAISDATNNMATQSEKAASAAAIFGREGVSLLNTMKLGSEGLAATAHEAEVLGLTLSRVDAAKVEAANDSMTRMSASSAGFGKILTVAVAPYIQAVADALTQAGIKSNGFRDQIGTGMELATRGVVMLAKAFYGLNLVWDGLKLAFNVMSTFLQEGLLKVMAAAQSTLEFANVGGVFDDQVAAGQAILEQQAQIVATLKADRESILAGGAETLSQYDTIEGKVLAYKAAIEAASQAAAESVAASAPGQMETDGAMEASITQAEADKYAAKLAALDTYLADEQERLFNASVARAEMVTAANESGIINEETRNALLEKIAADHQTKLTALTAKGLTEREKFQAKSMAGQVKQVVGALVEMTAGTARENKAMFAINKAAAIANAIINTYQGASLALATYPGPIGWAMAAATVAVGIAQIMQIATTSFGSSAAPSVAATGASGTVQTVDPLEQQGTRDQQPAGNVFNLTVYGSVVDHDAFARETFDAFQRASNDGMDR